MKILLTHAYSTTNSGDGLLVEESMAIAREAFPGSQMRVHALDPGSFHHLSNEVEHPLWQPSAERSSVKTARAAARALARGLPSEESMSFMTEADLVLAVGGGYLRGGSALELVKAQVAHFPQLPLTSFPPTVYLPQSIGPLPNRVARLWARRLGKAKQIHARDNRTLSLLRELGLPATRTPDLALLKLGATGTEPQHGQGVGIVARDLNDVRYDSKIRELARLLDAEPLVQADSRGNNDAAYYDRLGWHSTRTLREASNAADRPGLIVSVRLHGSLEAVLNGIPSIHLAYERKGFGAYSDLGVGAYVHSSRTFPVQQVAAQASSVLNDPSSFWGGVRGEQDRLAEQRQRLVESIRNVV